MFRLLIKFFIIFISLPAVSCGFIDLRQINYTTEPDDLDFILSDYNTPLIIKFNTEMIKKDVEKIFQVSSDFGAVKGDFNWKDNDIYFVPVEGWIPGIKYSFMLNGTVRSKDKRELLLNHFSSFYAVNKMSLPGLDYYYPADGQSVSARDFYLELRFTHSMDKLSVESALSIEGAGNKLFEWQDDDKIIIVKTEKQLSPWTSYRWSLKDSAKTIDGLPLPKQYSGFFSTDLDKTFPRITGVKPAMFINDAWNVTGRDIETGLQSGEAVIIEFNKPMDESVLRYLRFEPSLSGRAEFLTENKVVYIPSKTPEPETSYTLIIPDDVKDTEGLKLESEFRLCFTPDIPYLKVLSFNDGINLITENLFSGVILPIHINSEQKKAVFSLGFSVLFNNEEKLDAVQQIKLSVFFPKTLPPAGLQFIKWISGDRIQMAWEGLEESIEQANLYELKIPGGVNGINAGGFYLKEDFVIYLEVIHE